MRYPAIRVNQLDDGKELFVASVKIKDLIDETHFAIDFWDQSQQLSEKQGYQRRPSTSHVKKIANYAINETKALFPGAILINSRSPLRFEGDKNGVGELVLSHPPLWIVDGQHRIRGLRHAIENLEDRRWEERELPVVVLSNFNKIEEVKQFHILNSTQKRITTDLAHRLLAHQAEKNPEDYQRMIQDNSLWIARVLRVVDMLNEKPESPWYKTIQVPNTDRIATHIIKQNSMVKSLQPLFRDGYFSSVTNLDKNYQVLRDYWVVLKEIFPAAFSRPKEYVIQKTPGVFSLHNLAHAITLRGLPEYSKGTFAKVLKEVFDDKDDYYWASENQEGAAVYGSMKGFRILSNDFIEKLQEN